MKGYQRMHCLKGTSDQYQFLVRFVEPGNHTFEVAYKSSPDCAEINMHKHEERHKKANDYMDKIIEFESASSHNFG